MGSRWEKKRTKGHVTVSLPTRATGSLHPGRKEHMVSGNTLEQSFLIYSLSNKRPTFLFRNQRARMDGQMSGVFLGCKGNSFMPSFIHFQKFKFRNLVPLWASYHLLEWPKNGLSRDRITFICAKTAQAAMELGQVLHSHTCTVWNFPNVPQSSSVQKQLHSFSLG